MKIKLLLHLLTARSKPFAESGNTMIPGILVILALLVGTIGLVAIVSGSNLASLFSGQARDSMGVAEAGADQIIATFNQAENRKLLVAGSTSPSAWSTTNDSLRSPCISTAGLRPGGTGFPSTRAVGFADGNFRDLDNPDNKNTGNRRFLLKSIRYYTGASGSLDRRTITRTYTAAGTSLNPIGTIPTGSTFDALVNLDDPDGGGALKAGSNTGYIAVTVEGRLYRADGTFTTSTITKEFEVLPKCCGGSFGSNNTGGRTDGSNAVGDITGALGADSRYCGIEFGMITGLNGGRFLSQAANDRYTRRNISGSVVPIGAILGVISDPSYVWDRKTSQVVGGVQVGCRTIPSPCNTATEIIPGDTSGNNMTTYYSVFTGSTTPGACPPATYVASNSLSPLSGAVGDSASIAGRAASCIPIIPLYLKSGLPSIASKYTYTWTTPNPQSVITTAVTSASPGQYPVLAAGLVSGETADIWLRGNGASNVNQIGAPFLEYCNTRYTPNNKCESVFNGSTNHTWAVVSRSGAVPGGIGADFSGGSPMTSYTAASTPRWPIPWQTDDNSGSPITNGSGDTAGDMIINGGVATFRDEGADFGAPAAGTAPALARAVNLYALQTPVLEFTTTNVGAATNSLLLSYSFAAPITTNNSIDVDTGWVNLATINTSTGAVTFNNNGASTPSPNASGPATCTLASGTRTCRIAIPPVAYQLGSAINAVNRFSHFVKFRLRANSNLGTGDSINVDNFRIVGSTAGAAINYANWCEYSSSTPSNPAIQNGGFHCLGPLVDIRTVGNNLWIDTSDHSISFYYNQSNDSRGIGSTSPLINLFQGGTMANVFCSRGSNILTTQPTENCITLIAENNFSPVGEYDRFNIFGRDTTPANTCIDAGQINQPCNQVVIIGADSGASSSNRARIAGAWIYMPWGLVSFCVNGCGPLPQLTYSQLFTDDSWNYGGRLWVRSILAGGQNHFRVPPSASSTLTNLVGSTNSADVTYIGWEGVDWVARATSNIQRNASLN